MSVEHDHVSCDGCPPGGQAVVPIASRTLETWRVVEMREGSGTHLCPRCADRVDRGLPTSHAYVLQCVVCRRDSRTLTDTRWWTRPGGDMCGYCHDLG